MSEAQALQSAPGIDAATVCEAFQRTVAACPDAVALRSRAGGGGDITWEEYAARTRSLAAGFAALGVRRGDTVALMLGNRPEFHLADNAVNHLGAVPFSIYNTAAPEQIAFMLDNADARLVITERQLLARLAPVAGRRRIVVVDGDARDRPTLADVEAAGEPAFDFESAWRGVGPRDLLTLIYTSGTTGDPKPVPVTHERLFWYARSTPWLGRPGGRLVSYLPMAHIAERNLTHAMPRLTGATVMCCDDPAALFDCVRELHPTGFLGVPRIWEKLKAAIEGQQDGGFREALAVCARRVEALQTGEPIDAALEATWFEVDRTVMQPIRERVGLDQADWLAVGSAPVPRKVLLFFHALGLPIMEAWGLSETSAVATVTPQDRIRIGSVGKPVDGIELRIADDGEVLVRGPLVFDGYLDDPVRTAEAIDAAGWFHTGDVGRLDEEGFLWITDRKKELIVTSGGKNLSPVNIEAHIKSESPLIGQAVAIGDRRPYVVALIVLDPDAAAALADDHAVDEEIGAAIERANQHLSRAEQVKRWTILPVTWAPGSEELTPTMKLKRPAIARRYAGEIDELYA